MENLSWQIGDVRVTRIQEIEDAGLEWVIAKAGPENLRKIPWLAPHFVNEQWEALLSVHALVVETPELRIVVDTCVGNDKNISVIKEWHMRTGPFLERFEASGFARESIDRVLCTHLHVDHVGWNTILVDGTWQPTFPNARYLIAQNEWDHWDGQEDEFSTTVLSESVRPIWEAGQVDLVEPTHPVCREVWLEPSPGHTPGHVSIRIESGDQQAFITGDMIHHPCQFAEPSWGSHADTDWDQGVATRESFFESHAGTGMLVIGTHFAGPTAGRVVRDGDTFRLDVD
ncbi:MAG: MBL fold metallo-hydrolase [Deltaproteobacteria bacterium]|nr:MBL fold metallo-hydrolase [Deltaproteobacteria bacterium]